MKSPARIAAWLLVVASCGVSRAQAQQSGLHVGLMAIGEWTRANPMPYRRTITEARVVQPMAMLDAQYGALRFHGVLNLEGLTVPGGELAPGSWGEGFNDRRHPHTYAHELMASLTGALSGVRLSLSAGKGFAPFGTDDPMNRPVVRFPVNHHWAQVLERAVGIVGVAAGPAVLEFGWFNGDEPERPSSWPLLRNRFGDSWAARLLLRPVAGLELQGSRASVKSPEHREPAAGPRHEKWSVSARYEGGAGGHRLRGLAEWARNAELDGTFVYHSGLVETELMAGRHRPYARLERTERPEEMRLLDPFRSVRPHFENSNLGTSRWLVVTAGYGFRATRPDSRIRLEPVAEVAVAHVTMVTPGTVFTPQDHFGGNDLLSVSVALRVGFGAAMHRMGRYGVVATPPSSTNTDTLHHMHE